VQYVAVLSGWGVDAERIQAAINAKAPSSEQGQVPRGGVLFVFALTE
jgi:alcohol dehydrogenase (cytochrome c)